MQTNRLPLIFVVDDESRIRRLLTKELEANGFDVICAGDGEQAVEVFSEADPKPVLIFPSTYEPPCV